MPSVAKNPLFFTLLAVGVVGGLLAGLLGVGGGVIMVPLLLWRARLDQRRAQATSLLAIAPAALIGTASYAVGGVFPVLPALILAAGAVAGAQLGAYALRHVSLGSLRWGFILFVSVMAITVMVTSPQRDSELDLDLGVGTGIFALGIVMGTAAGLFGIGGGIIAIPVLMLLFGVGDLEAKGMSLIAMAPAALSGSLSHLRHHTATLRDGAWVALGALCATPIGALGAFALPERYANVVFGGFALTIAIALAIQAIRKPKRAL